MERLGRTLLAAAVSLLLLPACATAGFDEGVVAIDRGDYNTAFREFMPVAAAGDPWAQFMVGGMYDRGWGVPHDDAEAVRWYRLAAEQGLAEAQHNLGVMYEDGEGVPQDHTEAVRWYRLAADQGYVETQLSLGVMYATGRGVPQDFMLAYMWINLGLAGLPPGKDRDSLVEVRVAIAGKLTPAQLARAQGMARSWRPPVAARVESESVEAPRTFAEEFRATDSKRGGSEKPCCPWLRSRASRRSGWAKDQGGDPCFPGRDRTAGRRSDFG